MNIQTFVGWNYQISWKLNWFVVDGWVFKITRKSELDFDKLTHKTKLFSMQSTQTNYKNVFGIWMGWDLHCIKHFTPWTI